MEGTVAAKLTTSDADTRGTDLLTGDNERLSPRGEEPAETGAAMVTGGSPAPTEGGEGDNMTDACCCSFFSDSSTSCTVIPDIAMAAAISLET